MVRSSQQQLQEARQHPMLGRPKISLTWWRQNVVYSPLLMGIFDDTFRLKFMVLEGYARP